MILILTFIDPTDIRENQEIIKICRSLSNRAMYQKIEAGEVEGDQPQFDVSYQIDTTIPIAKVIDYFVMGQGETIHWDVQITDPSTGEDWFAMNLESIEADLDAMFPRLCE